VVLIRERRLLLTLRAHSPWRGWWEIPGGFQNAGEHPEDGARREIAEEIGVEAELSGYWASMCTRPAGSTAR
jgi:ADP-ribose pyrophosphatase YjhB (NUDIX family)